MFYDIRIWEEIRDRVARKTNNLAEDIEREIASDPSLREFREGPDSISWQLQQVMQQRAESWVERLYSSCCEAYTALGKEPSEAFDKALWAYCVEPFILREQVNDHGYRASALLELLLIAVGSPADRRRLLRVAQKDACVAVRGRIWEIWRDKLLHLPPGWKEAAAAIGRYNAMERQARRLVAGLPMEQVKLPQSPGPVPVTAPEEKAEPGTSNCPSCNELASAIAVQAGSESGVRDGAENPVRGEKQPFPEPVSEAKWEEIEICFISDERVQIRHGKQTETLNYAEFGFEDGRTGNPKRAWGVLRQLAEKGGTIESEIQAGMDWSRLEKRIQEIRSVFRAHFKISPDPIPFFEKTRVQDSGGYRAMFKISCARSYRR